MHSSITCFVSCFVCKLYDIVFGRCRLQYNISYIILAVVGLVLYGYTPHTERMRWSEPQLNGGTPSPALAAHGCAVSGRSLYIFGGLGSAGAACHTLYCLETGLLWLLMFERQHTLLAEKLTAKIYDFSIPYILSTAFTRPSILSLVFKVDETPLIKRTICLYRQKERVYVLFVGLLKVLSVLRVSFHVP